MGSFEPDEAALAVLDEPLPCACVVWDEVVPPWLQDARRKVRASAPSAADGRDEDSASNLLLFITFSHRLITN